MLGDAGDGFVSSDTFRHKVDGFARMMQKPDHVRITGQNFTFELAKDT